LVHKYPVATVSVIIPEVIIIIITTTTTTIINIIITIRQTPFNGLFSRTIWISQYQM